MSGSEATLPDWTAAFPALRCIRDPRWAKVLTGARVVALPAETTVFRSGDACGSYLLVLEGSVRVHTRSAGGREIVLYRVTPGQSCVLTTTCLVGAEHYPADGVTETPVQAVSIPGPLFQQALGELAEFRSFVFSSYAERLCRLIELLEEVAFGRMDARLAQCLLERTADGTRVTLTHQELAVELGTAREVVSRLLKDFERRGWVGLRRSEIALRDPEALARIANVT